MGDVGEFSLQGAKINCASFSKKLGGEEGDSENQKHEYFVTGDTHNNVRFYEFAAEEELIVTHLSRRTS